MVSSTISIATLTRAQTLEQAELLEDAIAALSRLNLPVYVGDGGSLPSFSEALQRIPHVSIAGTGTTLVQQVKTAVAAAHAAGAQSIVYTEPDKKQFFENGLAGLIDLAQRNRDAAMVVAARNNESFSTFPDGQQQIETSFNTLAAHLIGTQGDLLYGPLVLNSHEAINFALSAPDNLGWGWRPFVTGLCLNASLPVLYAPGYYPCPEDQRNEDDNAGRAHRLAQLSDNIRGVREVLLNRHAHSVPDSVSTASSR